MIHRTLTLRLSAALVAVAAAGCDDPEFPASAALSAEEGDDADLADLAANRPTAEEEDGAGEATDERGDPDPRPMHAVDDADDDVEREEDLDASDGPAPDLDPDAGIDAFSAAPRDPDAIFGGIDVATCGWPSTVELGGSCSGSLVHPEVVIYAAHCGASYGKIYLGESIAAPARAVAPEWCVIYPGGGPGEGDDFAVCKLAEPVTDVPIVPILMGCETAALKAGAEVALVGFGNADEGPYGVKREVRARVNGFKGDEIFIGGAGKDTCQGDSGGPVYVQLADGTWRVFGITSYGGACGTGGYYSMMHVGMEWFETTTGLDLTPCHDADGTWNPGPGCGDFLLAPGSGGGTWDAGCETGPRSGSLSATCGPPHGDPQPAPPPWPRPAPCADCERFTAKRPRGEHGPATDDR